MKKRMKKLVSMLIVSSMCLSMLATTAFAATTSGDESGVPRISGKSRYETSFAIADTLKAQLGVEKFTTVIVADGTNFPDALAGSYLAAKKDAPILMVDGDNDANIAMLGAYVHEHLAEDGKVYILGGTGAVSKAVEEMLSDVEVERLSGTNRYETNLVILEEAGLSGDDLLVCTGKTFADSLSASATGKPILLVDPTAGLTASQKEFLDKNDVDDVYIIGGTAAVGSIYEEQLGAYDDDGISRVKGSNRYETSTKVAGIFFDKPAQVVTASAWNFPDGLCGGPLAYFMGAPMILTGADMTKNPTEAAEEKTTEAACLYLKSNGITAGLILGGAGVLSENVANIIFGTANDGGESADAYKLIVTQHDPEASPTGEFLNNWAAEVEEKSDGRIDIQIYHGGALAGPKDSIDAVLSGTVDIAWGLQSYYAGQFPATEVFTLPCLGIDSAVEGTEALWNFYTTTDYMDFEYNMFHVLFLHTDCQAPIATVDQKIEKVSDLQGMKIRISAGAPVTFVTELGASPEGCAINDLYSNLDKGVYDGCITNWDNIERFKFYETIQYFLDENVGVSTYFLLMNPDSYAELPEDLQAILDEVSADAGKYTVAWDEAEDAIKAQEGVAEKLYTLSETERANLEAVAKDVAAAWIAEFDERQEIYDAAMKCIADAKK